MKHNALAAGRNHAGASGFNANIHMFHIFSQLNKNPGFFKNPGF